MVEYTYSRKYFKCQVLALWHFSNVISRQFCELREAQEVNKTNRAQSLNLVNGGHLKTWGT